MYDLGLYRPSKYKNIDLLFGKNVHEALVYMESLGLEYSIKRLHLMEWQNETKTKNRLTAIALLKRFATEQDDLEFVNFEKSFHFQLGNHTWKGRMDGEAISRGQRWVIEYKTTQPQYLSLKPNDQFIAYHIGAGFDGVLVINFDLKSFKIHRHYLQFSHDEIEEWKNATIHYADFVDMSIQKGILPKSPESCFMYNRPCPYKIICDMQIEIQPEVIKKFFQVDETTKNLDW
jgi:hypothetical protein